MKPPVDFVIVTALEEELDAVLAKLDGYSQLPPSEEDVRVYYGCDLPATFSDGSVRSYRVVVVPLLNIGRVEAANATGDAIRRWHPSYLLLIGIAGGVAEMGVGLGDILISDQIVDGELQKTTASGPQVRYSVHGADPRLLGAAKNYFSNAWLKLIKSRRPRNRKGTPKRKIGPILTGDKVIAFKDHLANYRADWPKLIGVEMEAGGVASACFQAKAAPGFLMVRCVSDLADEQKDSATVEKWRPYVCEVAAAYAIGLLQSGPVVPLGPSVGRSQEAAPGVAGRTHNLPSWMAPEYFIGRHEELQILSFGLTTSIKDAVVRPHVIYGGGGVGKSRLAIQTAWLIYLKGECNMAFFVSAATPVELATQLASLDAPSLLSIYRNVKPPEELETRKKTVIDALRTKAGQWVLILDNADSEQARDSVIQLFKELAGGRFIVTSRREDWPRTLVRKVAVNVFNREDAVACLLSRYWKGEPSYEELAAFNELAYELGCLPLALALAGSYMESLRITPQRYLREWKQKQETFLNFVAKDVDYGCSLLAAFKVSYDCLSTSAAALLRHLAWIAPEPFPRTQLENSEFLKMNISADIAVALAELQMLSLVAIEDESLSLHRLVLDCVRTIMSEKMRRDSLFLASVCVELMLPLPEWDEVGWRLWDQLAAHVRTLLDWLEGCDFEPSFLEIMKKFGLWLFHRAQYVEAEPLLRRVLAIDEKSFGPADPRVAIDLNNLAQLLQATNRLSEAEPLMRRALVIDEKCHGPEHPRVATDLNNLAQLLQATNRLPEAEPLMRRALAIDEKCHGPEHPRVATDLNNLAQLLQATNRLSEAEPLMRRALAIDEKSFGADHPKVAIRLNNLALLLRDTNRLAEAEPLVRRALKIEAKSYGAEHPEIVPALNTLASLLVATNRPSEAEPLMRQALAIDEKSFGADHPKVAIRLNNLAQLLVATNRLSEAESQSGRGLVILLKFSRSTGYLHPDLKTIFSNHRNLISQILFSDDEIDKQFLTLGMEAGFDRESYQMVVEEVLKL